MNEEQTKGRIVFILKNVFGVICFTGFLATFIYFLNDLLWNDNDDLLIWIIFSFIISVVGAVVIWYMQYADRDVISHNISHKNWKIDYTEEIPFTRDIRETFDFIEKRLSVKRGWHVDHVDIQKGAMVVLTEPIVRPRSTIGPRVVDIIVNCNKHTIVIHSHPTTIDTPVLFKEVTDFGKSYFNVQVIKGLILESTKNNV